MASLVANYSSGSDSELDSEDETGDCALVKVSNQVPEEDHQEQAKSKSQCGNLLMVGEESSDDSSDEDARQTNVSLPDPGKPGNLPKLPNPMAQKVPLPSPGDIGQDTTKNSVFTNPFLEAETAKNSILEKHVKMTEHVGPVGKTGKQICYKFRKGKCRFGTKCKYSHDLDNVPGVVQQSDQTQQSDHAPAQTSHTPSYYGNVIQEFTPVMEDEDSYMAQAKKKRKCGVTDTLQPPKRALQDLGIQRSQERPWTVKR